MPHRPDQICQLSIWAVSRSGGTAHSRLLSSATYPFASMAILTVDSTAVPWMRLTPLGTRFGAQVLTDAADILKSACIPCEHVLQVLWCIAAVVCAPWSLQANAKLRQRERWPQWPCRLLCTLGDAWGGVLVAVVWRPPLNVRALRRPRP